MLAGDGREAVLHATDRLCAELGYSEGVEEDGRRVTPAPGGDDVARLLDAQDELLVSAVRGALARVAAAVAGGWPTGIPTDAVCAALDGAEMVMRGELLSGNAELLPSLMPSFVFLVTLPIVDQDKALDLSRRTSELIEQALMRE